MESILGGDDEGIPLATQAILIKQLEEQRIANVSQAAIDALPAGREKQMVIAIDEMLSSKLGSADGYIGSIGFPLTRRLQRALSEYGITPDYGQSIGCGLRRKSRA
jgi:hypothetical protein